MALSVITGDEKALTVAPGIGKKLAQRIILELKDKLSRADGGLNVPSGAEFAGGDSPLAEAQAALCVLGYSPVEAAMAVKGLDETLPLEEIIRQALKRMSR